MPQVLILLAIGAGIYAGSKWLGREFERRQTGKPHAPAEHVRPSSAQIADRGALEFDPEENVYRPRP